MDASTAGAANGGFSCLTFLELAKLFCAQNGRWALYLSFDPSLLETDEGTSELLAACPLLVDGVEGDKAKLSGGECLLFFADSDAAHEAYEKVVGDDGPTGANPYAGPVAVYAQVVRPDGRHGNENT